jgi:hypothetical protein
MNLSRSSKQLVLALAVLIALGSLFWYVQSALAALSAELAQQVELVQEQTNRAQLIQTITAELDATAEKRQQLERFVVQNENDTITLLALLDTLADERAIALDVEDIVITSTETEDFDHLELALAATGADAAVQQLVALLETLPYQSQVQSLALDRSGAATNQSTIDVVLTVTMQTDL